MPKAKKKEIKCERCKKGRGIGKLLKLDKGFSCFKCLDDFISKAKNESVSSVKKPTKKVKNKLTLEDFTRVIPACIIDEVMPKRMANKFWKFMGGQTMQMLERQGGVYACDLDDFLKGRDCTD